MNKARKIQKNNVEKNPSSFVLSTKGACICAVIVFILLAIIIAMIATHSGKGNVSSSGDVNSTGNAIGALTDKQREIATYIDDTNYTGADVPMQLYSYPFSPLIYDGFTQEDLDGMDDVTKAYYYLPNILVKEELTEEEMQEYVEKGSQYMSSMFEHDYRDILDDQQGFIDSIVALYPEDIGDTPYIYKESDDTTTISDYAAELAAWFIENEATTETEFVTDQSLLYRGYGRYTLRGALKIKIHSTADKITPLLGVEVKNNELYVSVDVVFDIQNTDKIYGINFLEYIE